jgi:hypothetical protein
MEKSPAGCVCRPYGDALSEGQALDSVYPVRRISGAAGQFSAGGRNNMVGALAIAMFIALVGFGSRYFGWSDPDGKVQLALATSFILGIIGGYKAKG